MKELDLAELAPDAGFQILVEAEGAPRRAVIDSRDAGPGDLFVGLPGARVDGGSFAADVLARGAWGVLVAPGHAAGLAGGAVLVADDPLLSLQCIAAAWRGLLGATVIAVTGSVGKTSTKDLIATIASRECATVASRANFNTEIGLPLEILAAPAGTELLVLELAMRGPGQIAELAGIASPDVGVITNVGPVHLELLGSLANIAAAKAELVESLEPHAVAVLPANEPLLDRWRGDNVLTFGAGGDVDWDGDRVAVHGEPLDATFAVEAPYQRQNALAAVAAVVAAGLTPRGEFEVGFGALRGQRIDLPRGARVINDCYNANPLSMRAALDDLAGHDGRRIAILGDMLELGPDEHALHHEIGAYAAEQGVDVLVTVGPLAAAMGDSFDRESHAVADAAAAADLAVEIVGPGDVVLVKGSRGVGLEVVAEALEAADG